MSADLVAVDERWYCPMCGLPAAAFISVPGGRLLLCRALCKQQFRVELKAKAHDA